MAHRSPFTRVDRVTARHIWREPLLITALCFLFGIVSASALPVMPGWPIPQILLVIALLLPAFGMRLPGAILLGAAWMMAVAGPVLDDRLTETPAALERAVTGRIIDIPARTAGGIRFSMALDPVPPPYDLPDRVRLNWYRPSDLPVIGERWRLSLRLRAPHGNQNPGGFDYERWLFSRRIGATGYVIDADDNGRLGSTAGLWRRVRSRLHRSVSQALGDSERVSVVTALLVGAQAGIAPDLRELFRASGTSHLMAISGLHVAMAAAFGALVGRLIWVLLPGTVASSRQTVILTVAVLSAAAYAVIAGFGLATRRALIMVVVAAVSVIGRRQAAPWRAYGIALLVVLALDPLAPLGVGFWLSFVAVGALLLQATTAPGRWSLVRRWTRAQLAVSLALLVPLVLSYGQVSVVAPLANLVIIPVFSIAIVPLALICGLVALLGLPVADALFGLLDRLLAASLSVLDTLVRLAPAPLQPGSSPPAVVLLAALGSLVALLPRGWPGRRAAPLLITPLLFWLPPGPDIGGFRLTTLDVGQGLSAVVQTHRHVLVFDAGPAWPGGDAGARTLVPYLRYNGQSRVDTLVVSHSDIDHRGGVVSLLRTITVGEIYAGPGTRLPDVPARECRAGIVWQWDGVEFRFLHPDPDLDGPDNDASCVLSVTAPSGRVLLTGDIEAGAESRVLAAGYPLAADLVVVPHHGSTTSSTGAFIAATNSRWVIYPAGWRNRWGFPRPTVAARWSDSGAQGWITGRDGAVTVIFPGQGDAAPPVGWRCERRWFWRRRDCGH